jgi:hypothetical protein
MQVSPFRQKPLEKNLHGTYLRSVLVGSPAVPGFGADAASCRPTPVIVLEHGIVAWGERDSADISLCKNSKGAWGDRQGSMPKSEAS